SATAPMVSAWTADARSSRPAWRPFPGRPIAWKTSRSTIPPPPLRRSDLPKTMQSRDRLMNAIKTAAARRGILLARYEHLQRHDRLATVMRIARERTLLLSHGEACQLLACLESTGRVRGDVAELGVAYGASAKLL